MGIGVGASAGASAGVGSDRLPSRLSAAEREERLKHALGAAGNLHPACLSVEYEYKVRRCVLQAGRQAGRQVGR